MKPVSAEFELCVACCRWAFAGDDKNAILDLCQRVDWPRFERVVLYHRVQGLVWNSLFLIGAKVPADSARRLSTECQDIAASNLRIATETDGLRSSLEGARIQHLFVKGLTAGALAYPKPLLKMGWDIDLLIDPVKLAQAIEVLRTRGYRQVIPVASTDLHSWHRTRKESVWTREPGLHVELHTRLADNVRLIPTIDVHSPRREVEVAPGIALPTLQADELFAYLCVHGASSAWFRLKWITDLAALVHSCVPDEIDRLYRRSQTLGAGHAAGQALLLAHRLYGTLDSNSTLRQELEQSWSNRTLYRAALTQLAGSREPSEPTSVRFGTLRVHATQLLLLPGIGFKASETFRQVRDAL